MSGNYLLDTNIVIAKFANDKTVDQQISKADEIFIPVIVLGELYFGARKSQKINENIQRIDEFAKRNIILDCDLETSKIYGVIKNDLKNKGKPIPENDIWISAIALQYNLMLSTRDNHFNVVDGLQIINW